MGIQELKVILDILGEGNSKNLYINNHGLSQLGQDLFYPKKGRESHREALLTLIKTKFPQDHQRVLQSLQRYHLTSYYTPKEIIDYQASLLKRAGFEPKTILEPSAGNGSYVHLLKQVFPKAIIVALEPDRLSYEILRANNRHSPMVTVLNSTFEAYYLKNKGTTFFDLVISNIPFGDIPIENAFEHDYINYPALKNVGNYFNVFAHEMCSWGGVTALLTSCAFHDRYNYREFREAILMNNDLLLANRFNNSLFKEEKTKVVTDLVLYQKVRNKSSLTADEKLFMETKELYINEREVGTNLYFHQNPKHVNGLMEKSFFHGTPNWTVVPSEEPLSTFLERHLNSFDVSLKDSLKSNPLSHKEVKVPKAIPRSIKEHPEIGSEVATANAITLGDNYTKNHTRLFFGSFNFGSDSMPYFFEDTYTKTKVLSRLQELVTDYIELRNAFVLLQLNTEKGLMADTELHKCFSDLEYQLDLFHFKWTSLNQQRDHLKQDFYFNNLRTALEKFQVGRGYIKNPAFSFESNFKLLGAGVAPPDNKGKTAPIPKELTSFEHATPLEMVKAQFDQTGQIALEKIARTFKTSEKELLIQGLVERTYFIQPKLGGEKGHYEVVPYFIFASGYIEDKIDFVQKYPPPYGLDAHTIIAALTEIKPARLTLEAIEFNFESYFIPLDAKEAFLKDLINEAVKINVGQFSATLTLLFPKEYNQEAHERFSVVLQNEVRADYKRILQSFAENQYPVIHSSFKDANGKTIKKLDKDATLMAQNLYEELQLHFKAYVQGNEQLKHDIEQNYYNAFLADVNVTVPKDWLRFPSTLVHEPYQHQMDSVLFGLSRGSALNDHQVGKGKTLSMGLLAYKLKQQGKSRRTLLLTLKSVAPQLEREIKLNLPQLNILRLDAKNMAKSKRAHTLRSLASNNRIDLVIAEHGHLKQIPKQRDFVLSILENKILMVDQDLETAKEYGNLKESKKLIKGLIKRKSGLEEKLKQTLKNLDEKKEGDITLADLQIDALLIDEAHYFKNIGFTTRHQNVSGLNTNADNQQNLDLEISIASIHDRAGEDRNVFFYSGTPLKNSVTELYAYQRYLIPNELKRKQIFNFDAWASIFLKQSVSIEPNIFGDPRMHARFRYFINLPELSKMYNSFTHICRDKHFKTHNLQLDRDFVILDSSLAYEELKTASLDFTKNRNQKALFTVPVYDVTQMKSAHIIALGLNRSLLIDPLSKYNLSISFSESDQFKLRRIAGDVAELYHKTKAHKGVCLVFSDLNVWKPNEYNSYDTLAQFLVEEHGIPKTEIAFAQERKARNATDQFQKDIREGNIRIAMGSTQVLGTGTNIQQRVVGIFHMDIPYSPDAFDQRAGRGLRKGNEIAELYGNTVVERFYGIKDTTDIFSYSLNTHKEKFREQIREADPNQRTYDDLIPDDKNLSYAQMQAALIGDMEQFQLVKLSDDLKFLEAQKKLHELNKANSVKTMDRIQKENQAISNQITALETSLNTLGLKEVNEFLSDSPFFEPLHLIEKLVQGSPLQHALKGEQEAKQKVALLNQCLLEKSRINVNHQTKVLVAQLPTVQGRLVFMADYVPTNKHYLFYYALELEQLMVLGKRQQKFDPEKLHLQLLQLIKKMDAEVKRKLFDFNYNQKSLETHQKKVNVGFPKEKMVQMDALKEEIRDIKKRRATS